MTSKVHLREIQVPVKRKGETEDEALARVEAKYLARATSPLRAIRAKCVQCQGGLVRRIAECEAVSCALHPFRMEKNTLLHRVKPVKKRSNK